MSPFLMSHSTIYILTKLCFYTKSFRGIIFKYPYSKKIKICQILEKTSSTVHFRVVGHFTLSRWEKNWGYTRILTSIFGMLSMEMHRAIRLEVDSDLHAKGWSWEEAIAYSLENEAESKEKISAEIERYIANPGQALSYKICQLKIRALREMAEKKMGKDFDIRIFHGKILESSAITLDILEQKIEDWIKPYQKVYADANPQP